MLIAQRNFEDALNLVFRDVFRILYIMHLQPSLMTPMLQGLDQGFSNSFPGDPNFCIKTLRDPKQKHLNLLK